MDRSRREEAIEQYVKALDEDDSEKFEEILTEDFTYRYGDGRIFEGRDEALEYFVEERSMDTVHNFQTIHHLEACSIGLGVAEVKGPDGYEAEMCDVFVFDEADQKLREVMIYTRPLE